MKRLNYNQIKSVLARKRKSNKDLAASLGVNEQTVSRWTTNKRQPNLETLYKIAMALDITVAELLTPIEELNEVE